MELYETFLPPQPITSCRWRDLPSSYDSGVTAWRRLKGRERRFETGSLKKKAQLKLALCDKLIYYHCTY